MSLFVAVLEVLEKCSTVGGLYQVCACFVPYECVLLTVRGCANKKSGSEKRKGIDLVPAL